MQRIVKSTFIMLLFILVFSLIGCGTTASTSSSKSTIGEVQTPASNKQTTNGLQAQQAASTTQTPSSAAEQKLTTAGGHPIKSPAASANKGSAPANTKVHQVNLAAKSSSAAVSANTKQTPAANASPESVAVSKLTKAVTKPPVQSVKLIIVGPNDQSKMSRTLTVNIKDGETVLDVLLHGIGPNNVDYSGSGATAYVSGIENVYQFDYGPKSGWTVSQNGRKLTKSAGIMKVKAGDNITWVYTKDYTVNN